MQLLSILATLTVAFGTVQAADICRLLTSSCGGSVSCCTGIQENRCCNLGTSVRTIRYTLPANSRAQGFTGTGCSGTVTTTRNPNARTVCLSYNSNRQSARWLQGQSSRVKRDPEVEACAEPNMVLRVRDGVTTKIELRDGMTVEDALESRDGEVVEANDIVNDFVNNAVTDFVETE